MVLTVCLVSTQLQSLYRSTTLVAGTIMTKVSLLSHIVVSALVKMLQKYTLLQKQTSLHFKLQGINIFYLHS